MRAVATVPDRGRAAGADAEVIARDDVARPRARVDRNGVAAVAGDDIARGCRRAADDVSRSGGDVDAVSVVRGRYRAIGVDADVVPADCVAVARDLDRVAGELLEVERLDGRSTPGGGDLESGRRARGGAVQNDAGVPLGGAAADQAMERLDGLSGSVDRHLVRDRWKRRLEIELAHARSDAEGDRVVWGRPVGDQDGLAQRAVGRVAGAVVVVGARVDRVRHATPDRERRSSAEKDRREQERGERDRPDRAQRHDCLLRETSIHEPSVRPAAGDQPEWRPVSTFFSRARNW